MPYIFPIDGVAPVIHPNSFIANSADVIGNVNIAECVSIWNKTVVRGDLNYIQIGKYTNVQDLCMVHADTDPGYKPLDWGKTIIGEYVSIGHGAIVHVCTVEDYCLIGMGAIVLDDAVIGRGSIVGAGSVVTPGTIIPPFSMVLGTPGKVVKTLSEDFIKDRIRSAEEYWELACKYK